MDYSWVILTRELSQAEYEGDWGGIQESVEIMRSQLIPGDQIWEYECSIDDRNPLSGTWGICLRRGGMIIDHVVTRRIMYG